MDIKQDYDLSKLNSFGIPVNAHFFVEVHSEEDLAKLFSAPKFKNNKKIFLGGGSNVLFTKNFDGIVILNKLKGVEILSENSTSVFIRSMSGEVWHDLVIFAVEHGLWGIENLSLIPGTVGAAPMQNIGAYGAELKDVLESVEAFDISTGKKKIFSERECEFGYRDSIFKNRLRDRYFISAITLKLSKVEKKNITYKSLLNYLEKNKIEIDSPKNISDAVIAIRGSIFPDPKTIGNAGSFFKNVFVSKERFRELLAQYPTMPSFEENGTVKIPSAWLIEECGWKGKREGNAGVHEKQALVLVNHGNATGQEVKELANEIVNSVFAKFGLKLVPEVNLI